MDLIQRLRRPVERSLYDADLSPGEVDRVVLVGGATRMPVIKNFVGKMMRRLPEVGLNPDHVVALGAAVQAGLVGKNAALGDVVMTDVSAFSLGIDVAKGQGASLKAGYFLPIIERNSVVPISREEVVNTIEKGQTQLQMSIYQGESPRVENNICQGELTIGVPRNMKEHENVSVRFSYDVSGLLEVDVIVLSTQKSANLLITELAGTLTDAEIADQRKRLAKLESHPRDAQENIATVARLEQCYAMAKLADREYLQEMLVEFETVLAGQNLSDIDVARQAVQANLDAFEANYAR